MRNGNDKFVVHYLDEKRKVFIKDGDTILATSLKFKINHQHVCGGNARCSSCRILVSEGLNNCHPRNKMELAVARTLMLNKNIRLACQTQVVGYVTISRPPFDELDVKIATLAIAEGSNYRKGQDENS